ncbi:DHH family phosphoesterase [Clostridium polynesiense]|uniref:DHH family phosphoesterase n=1 Tax=Clostridium polynesiense TaxID=1325933 RepID=UPI00058B5F68|nr:DHH family phosphoesterase [Clostridium polynesiense]
MINNKFNINNNMYGILSAILILILFAYGHEYIALAGVIVLIVLVLYYLKEAKDKRLQQELHIKSLAQDMSLAAEETLIKLPFPLVIVDEKGEIHWFNNLLNNIFEKQIMLGSNINTLIKSINIEDIFKKKKEIYKDIIINKKHYNIYSKIMNSSTDKGAEKIVMLYLHDISNVTDIIATKESIMLIEVDNLNEVVKSTENDNAPLLIAEIERTINNYAQNLNAMIKKYDSNKYILSVQDKYIETQMSKKFDILDTVREINMGNKYDVTLSIGVGRNGISPLENHKYASTAKELALGRGGDQAVIKSGDNVAFFGGNTKEVEKRTRVRARVVAHALKDLVNESSTVYIMGHRNPDMDCLGAAIGVASAVKQLGKSCFVVLPSEHKAVDFFVNKLKKYKEYDNLFISPEQCKREIGEESLLIMVDVHSRGYVQDVEIAEKARRIVIIDHHRRSPDSIEGALLTYIEVYASSTSELVTEIIQYMFEKPKLLQIEAEGLLAGITMDTKNFYFKTGVRTFEAASFLRRLGADTIDIKKMFSDDLESYIKKAEIIRSAKVENSIAFAVCPPNIDEIVLAAQAADELLNITGIQASFVFVKIGEDINISGRSFGDVNVQVILEAIGGGGHMTIAGAKLTGVTMEEAVKMLKDVIAKYLKEGDE